MEKPAARLSFRSIEVLLVRVRTSSLPSRMSPLPTLPEYVHPYEEVAGEAELERVPVRVVSLPELLRVVPCPSSILRCTRALPTGEPTVACPAFISSTICLWV